MVMVEAALLATPVPPLAAPNIPATSAVAKSTASVVVPEPLKILAVRVSDTCESVSPVISEMLPVVMTVPEKFGKVYVLSATVRSAVVMMPANLPAPPACGKNLMSSSVDVAERAMSGGVPAVAVKMFCAEVVKEVAVATPRVGVVSTGDVEKTRLVEVVPVVPAAERPVILLKHVMEAEPQLVPPLATGNMPATSAVARSTAFVVEPEPMKILDVRVSDTSESTMSLAWKVVVEPKATVPFSERAVEVEAPLPVTDAKVSASAVK